MKKNILSKVASWCSAFFAMVLFVGANSGSSAMMYQKEAPAELERFSKIK